MSWEDMGLRVLGLSAEQVQKIHVALEEAEKSLAIAETLFVMVKAEIPRIERTVATFKDILATVNANQRKWGARG